MSENSPEANLHSNVPKKSTNFICGVVEGFYGRPWTTEQRKDLFQKMKKWGLDSYVYAPKDDYKHRAYWRELYTVEEAEHLTGLIQAAHDQQITFYYALSPGLDITYSSVKEVAALKRKLEQVAQFGCAAFALLFDDIESEMSEADKEVFQSFAQAQVSITNDIYQHLGQPRFLVCPTQYCSSRAVPNVTTSEYLTTLGQKLAPDINIMWTGQRVISRSLTVENIDEITEVLRRPPLIWDNIHANDYDQKRVYLGPYTGRSPDLIPRLRGVLTNPNCEYGANYVAIHTLAQWSHCNVDGQRDLSLNDTVSADIKLETETEDGLAGDNVPASLPPNTYHPRCALKAAVAEWLGEFARVKNAYGPIMKPQPSINVVPIMPIIPSINTCMTLTGPTTTTTTSTLHQTSSTTTILPSEVVVSSGTPGTTLDAGISLQTPVMNSLVADNKVVCTESITNTIAVALPIGTTTVDSTATNNHNTVVVPSLTLPPQLPPPPSEVGEPMECSQNNTPNMSPVHTRTNISTICATATNSSDEVSTDIVMDSVQQESTVPNLTVEDLLLLCDLFYLPFEHGAQGLQILQEFQWLKSNAAVVLSGDNNVTAGTTKNSTVLSNERSPEAEEWYSRSAKLNVLTLAVNRLYRNLTECANRELLYDLYAYVWDIRGVISLLNSYIQWLAGGQFPVCMPSYTQGTYTWFSKGWKETFMSGEQEPWVFRGGLTADLQRLMPVDSGNNLFVYRVPEVPTATFYTVRPYRISDEPALYELCTKISWNYQSENVLPTDASNLESIMGDSTVGPYITFYPEFALIVEDNDNLVGYACAAPSYHKFRIKLDVAWLPEMQRKYPKSLVTSTANENCTDDKNTVVEVPLEIQRKINDFHRVLENTNECNIINSTSHPASMICNVLPTVEDQSVAKRLVTCLLAALRSNGCCGVFSALDVNDTCQLALFGKLGFIEIGQNDGENSLSGALKSQIIMGRTF